MSRFEMSLRSKILSVLAVVVFLGAIRMSTRSWAVESTAGEQPLPGLMLAKLASSQTIVAGLVSKDFDQIRKGAKDLVRICDASEWSGNTDETYAHHRKELRRQAIRLAQLAEEQNLDGSAYVYMHTVSTCIHCHQHCRDILRIADQKRPASGVIRIPAADESIDWTSRDAYRR